jgi:histone H3/H4
MSDADPTNGDEQPPSLGDEMAAGMSAFCDALESGEGGRRPAEPLTRSHAMSDADTARAAGPDPSERRPMLYSAMSLGAVEAITGQLWRLLTRKALERAKRDGRHLVTDDDVWDALRDADLTGIFADPDTPGPGVME